jgi:uncharacterized membrane protein
MPLLPMSQPLLYFHICAAIVGLLSGGLAMIFRKGSGRHGAAGTVFFVSMLCMAASAAFIALFMHRIMVNIVVAFLTLYLVPTGWVAIRRRNGETNRAFDIGAMLFVLADGIAGVAYGIGMVNHPERPTHGIPTPMYFVFGSIAILFAVSDVRMLLHGGLFGAQRIGRHLWRMCLALWIATMSAYPGQAKLYSKALRATNLLFVPHVLLIGATIFWLYRISRRKRAERARAVAVAHPEALAA